MNSEIKFMKFPLVNSENEDLGIVTLEHLWADVFALKMKIHKEEALVQLNDVVKKALKMAEDFQARLVMYRLIKDEITSAQMSALLPNLGFTKKSDRIEFKKSVDELPIDEDSPIIWKTAEELKWQPESVAKTLKQVAEGDPDTDPNEDPLLFIQDFLADPVLTSGLRCIHIGFFENEIAALTVVQINPKTGWSRISYIGVMPKFRKKNFGNWVHRYSFKVMRAEGGKLYHGGTTSTNAGMIKLFEKNGCSRFCEMEEWVYSLKGGELC
ncbi:MAG: GNAT family N-acetyltransferase [Pseudobdellovibrionaceae bacterium]